MVSRAISSGAHFGLATGRPHRWLIPVLEQLPVAPVCVCANGAVVYDPTEDRVLHAHELTPDTMGEILHDVERALAGVYHGYGVERVGSSALDPEDECFLITPEYNPDAWDSRFGVVDKQTLIEVPAAKLLVRCPDMTSAEMYDIIAPLIDDTVAHLTYSMDEGLIEISRPGANKATGAQYLADRYGLTAAETIAFGDMPNDLEMIQWAGTGVAMANAKPELKDAADHVTTTNDEHGVAAVLERWY